MKYVLLWMGHVNILEVKIQYSSFLNSRHSVVNQEVGDFFKYISQTFALI